MCAGYLSNERNILKFRTSRETVPNSKQLNKSLSLDRKNNVNLSFNSVFNNLFFYLFILQ